MLDENQLCESLYHGCDIEYLPANSDVIEEYDIWVDVFDLPKISSDPDINSDFFMPQKYKDMDISKYLHQKCSTEIEHKRIDDELICFQEADNLDFLKYLVYLSDTMTYNNIVSGVGRGSSVSLYSLYLIGIHKVNSIKYNLDFLDFFKIKEI